MCGIVGITVKDKSVLRGRTLGSVLTRLLKMLEYRGYDSVGIAVFDPREGLQIKKGKGKIDEVSEKLGFNSVEGVSGIGHTRWATHGAPSDANAHPHSDCQNTIVLVHNGIIKNFDEIKKSLIARGHVIRSETDTEVIAHLLEEYISNEESFIKALEKGLEVIEGSYAFSMIYSGEPEKIFFAKNLSPLIIGVGKGFNMLASDIPAILEHTKTIIPLRDGEYGWISPHEIRIFKDGHEIDTRGRLKTVDWSIENVSKGGYPHFMIKEIYEQPLALRETLYGLQSDPTIDYVVSKLAEADKIYVTGAGTSYHAGLVFRYYLSNVGGSPAIAYISSEYRQHLNEIGENDLLIAISQSGETIDTLKAVRAFKASGGKIIAVSNVLESAIPRESDYSIYMRAGPEIGVAATKTYLTQVLTLSFMVIKYASHTGRLVESETKEYMSSLSKAPLVTETSIRASEPLVKMFSKELAKANSMYVLGRGLGSILALEAALKIKEIDYIHAEAYPAGESKHGPIALVEPGFPVLFLHTLESSDELIGNMQEMYARGGMIYVTTNNEKVIRDTIRDVYIITIPRYELNILEPYAHIPPYQLLAYYIAVEKGYDPDKPRNLAKTVTVE